MKWLVILSLVLAFCFLPVVEVGYPTTELRVVEEVYTTFEPYTIQVEVSIPYVALQENRTWVDAPVWQGAGHYSSRNPDEFRQVYPGKWVVTQQPITKYRTETQQSIRWREVTKTRLANKWVPVMRTRKASLLQGFLDNGAK